MQATEARSHRHAVGGVFSTYARRRILSRGILCSYGRDQPARVPRGRRGARRIAGLGQCSRQASARPMARAARPAPGADDPRPVRFAFVSCQNVNQGAQHAYRRMIYEDERAPVAERLCFVLHLGDFIYEIVWYPEDWPQGMYDRRLRDIVRYGNGEKVADFHVPTTVDDYRAVYRAYLHDPDLQDARARWPFVCMWDNHEYSWLGWQGLQVFDGKVRPAQTKKVAANQAWFEYQPARIVKPSGAGLGEFKPPKVVDAPIEKFDEHGLGQEPNNLAAINSLVGYRALRFGRNVELIITDQRSYRSEEPSGLPGAEKLSSDNFP